MRRRGDADVDRGRSGAGTVPTTVTVFVTVFVPPAGSEDASKQEAARYGGPEPCNGPGAGHSGEHTRVKAF